MSPSPSIRSSAVKLLYSAAQVSARVVVTRGMPQNQRPHVVGQVQNCASRYFSGSICVVVLGLLPRLPDPSFSPLRLPTIETS
jgi:hypothetical protein